MSPSLMLVAPDPSTDGKATLQDGRTLSISGAGRPQDTDRRNPDRTVMGRIAAIMEAFDGTHESLGLGELSASTGLPKSTLHRLADQLCQVGWIERTPGGYRIGLRMFELGSLAVGNIHEAAFPHLQALAARTGMSVHLGVLDQSEVVIVERVQAGPARLSTRRGSRVPAQCTALGKALAAFDDDAARTVLASPMTDPVTFRAELAQVRKTGVAFDRGELGAETVCIAAPIGQSGNITGAVSVTGLAGRMRWGAATEAVRSAASAISNANSHHGRVGVR